MQIMRIKRNDTSPALEYRLSIYSSGSGVLAGASARFHMKSRAGTMVVDAAAVVSDADGILQYLWDAADTATAGNYDAEFEVTYGDSTVETFPNSEHIKVIIAADLA